MQFDLLIKNGTVIDPSAQLHAQRDVAIKDGKIAGIDTAIPEESGSRTIDAGGLFVSPGFIDLHSHIYSGVGYWGIDPESMAWWTGVTTWVDAGTSGGFTYPGFERFAAAASTVTIRSFLNVSYLGLIGLNYDELCNLDACDVGLATRVIRQMAHRIIGVKVRMGAGRVGVGGLEPLRRAREIADATGVRVMVHIGAEPPSLADVLRYLRPGDIITHCFTGATMHLLDADGSVRPCVQEARARGVRFDIGHGSGSFSFASADALTKLSFWPDTISTDMHHISYHGPNIIDPLAIQTVVDVRGDGSPGLSLPLVMSKLLYLGMPLDDVIAAVTSAPAQTIGMSDRIGALRVGMDADLAVFGISNDPTTFFDIYGARREAKELIEVKHTIKRGNLLAPRPTDTIPPWIRLVDVELSKENVQG
jgi:dihydroorotase